MSDPIIEEIHEARRSLWESCGQDWKALLKHLNQRSAEHPQRMVTQAELESERKANSSRSEPTIAK